MTPPIVTRGGELTVRHMWTGQKWHPATLPSQARGPGRMVGGPIVVFQAWTVALQVQAHLGPNGANITGGYGTWEAVTIPRSDPVTQWTGRTALTMDVDTLFDGWGTRISVEPQLQTLERLARKMPGMQTPPSLRIFGAVPHAGTRWVIADLTWGDAIRRPTDGARLRQAVTVKLLEFRDSVTLATPSRGGAQAQPPRKYKVKSGDTLKTIAAHLLGSSAKWQQIASANSGLRGWHIPAAWVGRTIKVPAR